MAVWRSHKMLLIVGLALLLSACRGQPEKHLLRVTVSSGGGCWSPLFTGPIQEETFTVREPGDGVALGKVLATGSVPALIGCDSFMVVFPEVPKADFYVVWDENRNQHWGPLSYTAIAASNWNIGNLIWTPAL